VYPLILLPIILLTFLLAGYQQLTLNIDSDALDRGAYLSAELAVKEEQRLTDPYRQPLLSWLMAFLAGREMSYFTWAKLLTLATGLGCVVGCYLVSLRLYNGPGIALLSAFLLVSNVFFIQESSSVMVEPLLALIMLLVWFFGLRALELDHWWDWAAGGVVTGLAYLAKESGLFWLPAWGVGTVISIELR
jgi:4-amino-4-deoxy-L-arabinose transferase-like glycosyltransferase